MSPKEIATSKDSSMAAKTRPRLRGTSYMTALTAVLGTTISPYLFFWQASKEVEEQKTHLAKSR
jgi:hypothetical protein